MEFAFEAIVDVGERQLLGMSSLGERRLVPITGGSFEGPRVRGTVVAGGADRQLIRPDGLEQFDALYELRTDDGAVVTVRNQVLVDETREGKRYAFSSISLSAPEGPHGWLNQRVFVGTLDSMKPARAAVRVRAYALV